MMSLSRQMPAFFTSSWMAALLALALFSIGARTAFAEERLLKAGAYAMDITPNFPISMNGGMQDRTALRAHDRLHARCLVFDNGGHRFAFVVVDSCMVPREVCDDAKRRIAAATTIPPAHVVISATHTHTAPTLAGVFQSEPEEGYRLVLAQKIAEGVAQACRQLEPAQVGWSVGTEPNQVYNRRWRMKPGTIEASPFGELTDHVKMNPRPGDENLLEPAGPIDPEVCTLWARSRTGRLIAALSNYSLHYVGDVPPQAVSADYFGAYAERLARQLGALNQQPPFVGIMSNGTSGNVNNINFRTPQPPVPTFGRIERVAEAVAQAAAKSFSAVKWQDWVELAAAHEELLLGVRKPVQAEIERALAILAKSKGQVLRTLPEIYARETVRLVNHPDSVPVMLQAYRIGELGIATIPCEVFVEIGLALKKESPLKPTFTMSLANGYNGYLPTVEHHRLGGYETWRARSSYLEVEAAPKIQSTMLKLLHQVAAKAPSGP